MAGCKWNFVKRRKKKLRWAVIGMGRGRGYGRGRGIVRCDEMGGKWRDDY